MSRFILILFCISVSFNIFSNIKTYEKEALAEISSGDTVGLIGWRDSKYASGGYSSPKTFAVGKNGYIYIPDYANQRINIYDLNLKFLKNIEAIEDLKGIASCNTIKVQDNSYITLRNHRKLIQLDKDGQIVFSFDKKVIPKMYGGFYPVGEFVFYYTKNGYVNSIDRNGIVYNYEDSKEILNNINGVNGNSNTRSINNFGQNNSDEKKIILNNVFQTTNERELETYLKNKKKVSTYTRSITPEIDISFLNEKLLIGFDDFGSSYWSAIDETAKKMLIFIYSNKGDILDIFYYESLLESYPFKISIAHTGDIYFMKNTPDKTEFYRIKKQW